jgi:hypothetical protein
MRTAFYFYRVRDDLVEEFCVANHEGDPRQYVTTLAPDGTEQRWEKREEGDLLVFHPPDGYVSAQGLLWCYDGRLQRGVAMPRARLEKEMLRMRTSIIKPEIVRV